jgi:hypothetical protein
MRGQFSALVAENTRPLGARIALVGHETVLCYAIAVYCPANDETENGGVTCGVRQERATGIEPAFSAWEANLRSFPDLH